MSRIAAVALAALSLLPAGCAGLASGPGGACLDGESAWTRETLYFGRTRPGGAGISDAEWQAFLAEDVTPRFPDGLTVIDADGQWRNAEGVVTQEPASVLVLLHPGDAGSLAKVGELTPIYRQRFSQEAVLRERSAACVRFQ